MIKNFNLFLNEEVDFNIIPTLYSSRVISNKGNNIEVYDFVSNTGTSYSVYFYHIYESNHLLDSGEHLSNIGKNPIPTIFFSPTSRGLNPLTFNTLVNGNEYLEVMGKVVFIITDYINNTKFDIFSIGDLSASKEKFYNHYLQKLPISRVERGVSDFYYDKLGRQPKIYYLIR